MNSNTVSRKAAVVGVGETPYYKHGKAPLPEFRLALDAIKAASADAGIEVGQIDGFVSFASERSLPPRLATALGLEDVAVSSLVWQGGGGGGSGAIAQAAAALAAGYAKYICVYRSLAQGQFVRLGQGDSSSVSAWPMSYMLPYGMTAPAHRMAIRTRRFMHEHGVGQGPMRAISMASYHHAQQNPRAVMRGKVLTEEVYDQSRWIVEPFHLYDCCMENDGAAAVILTTAERAKDLPNKPAYVLAAGQGIDFRQGAAAHNAPKFASSGFSNAARRLFEMAELGPQDIDVVQAYENFTGAVMIGLTEHGFCAPEESNDFMTFENFRADGGKFPLNTSGGNLAECYMHGLELVLEAARQIRGESPNQVPDVETSMVISGPMVQPVSNLILCA